MKGIKLDLSLLDQRFVQYYLRGTRIVVDLPYVGERVGKVAVTCDPRPEFILLTNRTDHTCVRHILDRGAVIVGIYVGRRLVSPPEGAR